MDNDYLTLIIPVPTLCVCVCVFSPVRYGNEKDPIDCSSYQYVGDLRVGCVVPYSEEKLQRFDPFLAWLYRNNVIIAKQEYTSLTKRGNTHIHPTLWLTQLPHDTSR